MLTTPYRSLSSFGDHYLPTSKSSRWQYHRNFFFPHNTMRWIIFTTYSIIIGYVCCTLRATCANEMIVSVKVWINRSSRQSVSFSIGPVFAANRNLYYIPSFYSKIEWRAQFCMKIDDTPDRQAGETWDAERTTQMRTRWSRRNRSAVGFYEWASLSCAESSFRR